MPHHFITFPCFLFSCFFSVFDSVNFIWSFSVLIQLYFSICIRYLVFGCRIVTESAVAGLWQRTDLSVGSRLMLWRMSSVVPWKCLSIRNCGCLGVALVYRDIRFHRHVYLLIIVWIWTNDVTVFFSSLLRYFHLFELWVKSYILGNSWLNYRTKSNSPEWSHAANIV